MIIGISGPMGSGKDTVASILEPSDFQRAAFADSLKAEVWGAINIAMRVPDYCPVTLLELESKDPWAKPTPPKMRTLLQWWGTEYRRSQDPQYWVNQLLYSLNPLSRYAIADVRFANEAAAIRSIGGQIWRITGRSSAPAGIPGHASEAIDFEPDLVIDNSGSISDLERKVYECLKSSSARFALSHSSSGALPALSAA